MRRAERKLLLSESVFGDADDILQNDGKDTAEIGTGDLRTIMFGLQMFDPVESNEEPGDSNMSELNSVTEKVLAVREGHGKDEKIEISTTSLSKKVDTNVVSASGNLNPDFDEALYISWVEKFKEVAQNSDLGEYLPTRRTFISPEQKSVDKDAARKKAREKKISKWESLGYRSLSVEEPTLPSNEDVTQDAGSVQFVYGDCSQPTKVCPSKPSIIFRLVSY